LSSLIARFAENIYWLGRYLERAENTARILDINETYARGDQGGPNWRRVLELYSDAERFDANPKKPTAAPAVLWYYVLDRDNPSSIVSCIATARENARSVRHLISTEMWLRINVLNAHLAEMNGNRSSTTANLLELSREVILGCQSFDGVAGGTFFRAEPWCFYQLGKYLERADQTTRILDIGYDQLTPTEGNAVAWVHWNVLLRSVSGYHAYRSRHPSLSSPNDIATFLLYDSEFPRAVALCVDHLTRQLRDVERRHGDKSTLETEPKRRALEFLLETGPGSELTPRQLHLYLDQVQTALAELSDAITKCYFSGR